MAANCPRSAALPSHPWGCGGHPRRLCAPRKKDCPAFGKKPGKPEKTLDFLTIFPIIPYLSNQIFAPLPIEIKNLII
jgi:hypothetical protein